MDFYEARKELQRMNRGDLFRLASGLRISRCLISGGACSFYLQYKGFNFCISEILGQGCQVERVEKLEGHYEDPEKSTGLLPLMEKLGMGALRGKKRNVEFRVYYNDCATRSIILLGKVIERRTKERGNNLKDLLVKAVKAYSDCVADPSTIFLLNS